MVLAACGGSSPTSNSSTKASPTPSPSKAALITGTIDACALVKASDVTDASGITQTSLTSTGGSGVCIYGGQTDAGTSESVFVYAQAYPDETTASAVSPEQMAAAMNGQVGIANAKAVSDIGVGTKAVEYTATSAAGGGIVLFVFKANVVMFIAVSPTTDGAKVEALARVAVASLDKLPKS
jgi:hypothetical protein